MAQTSKVKHKTQYKKNKYSTQASESTSKPQCKTKAFAPSFKPNGSSSKKINKKPYKTYSFVASQGMLHVNFYRN